MESKRMGWKESEEDGKHVRDSVYSRGFSIRIPTMMEKGKAGLPKEAVDGDERIL